MQERIGKFFNVRQDESLHVTYLLFHYFFQGIGLALLFTVANSLFLSHFHVEELPLVFISSAIVMLTIGKLYEIVGKRWSVPKTLKAITIFITGSVLLLYVGSLSFSMVWVPFALYIWYQVIASQVDTEFWGLSSIIFDVRQAKRLYGLISVGDVPAKLIGYLFVAALVPAIGLTHLLLIASASFLAGSILLHRLLSKLKPHHFAQHDHHTSPAKNKNQGVLMRFFQSDLVLALAMLYFVGAITLTFTEFSFLTEVEHKFHTETELAIFFARVGAIANTIIILCKLFLSGKAIERLGVKRSLVSLPLFLLLACISVAVTWNLAESKTPLMWIFTAMVIFGEVFKAVLYEPLFLALFQPLPGHIRHHAHNIVNGFVDPIGLGLSGLALYIGISLFHSINLYKIDYVLLALVIVWIVLVYYTAGKYMSALKSAINKRLIDSRKLKLGDDKSINILKEKLKSTRPDEVVYTAEMLSNSHPALFELAIPQLLTHEVQEVRLYIINKIGQLKFKIDSEELYEIIISDSSFTVREQAVKLYCSLYEDIVDRITPMLDYPELVVRSAAIKGFLKSGDIEAMIIGGQQLLKMLESKDIHELISSIDIIGSLGFKNYYKPLLELLHHNSADVKKAAIDACGKTTNPKLIPYLIPFLEDKTLKKAAIDALSNIGEPVFEYLKAAEFEGKYAAEAIKIFSRIGGNKAVDILFSDYLTDVKGEALDEALKALNRLNFDVKRYTLPLHEKLNKELDFIFNCHIIILLLTKEHDAGLLLNALYGEAENSKNRIFLLLSLIYDKNTIVKARNASFSVQKESRANAIEFLDNIIDRELKLKLFPVLEEIPLDQKVALLSRNYHNNIVLSLDEYLSLIIKPGNDFLLWTRAVVIYTHYESIKTDTLKFYRHSGENLLSESAIYAIFHKTTKPSAANEKTNHPMKTEKHHEHESMLEIEKVLILKSTSMFAATPENILVGIAGISREEKRQKGEDIFKKDDLGNCLYIICEGDIAIHIDGKELSVLHGRDIFGELALLDPEPRSASATALNDSLLLRIDQAAFNELIEDRPEVAQGILTILSRRIRNQNEVIRGLQEGIGQ